MANSPQKSSERDKRKSAESERSASNRSARSQKKLQEQLLAQIAYAASHCAEIERAFGDNPPPELDTLIKVYRVLILKLSAEAQANPDQLKLAISLMKPVLDWERFEDARNERERAEQTERETQQAARNREAGEDALRPETLEQIERELSLL